MPGKLEELKEKEFAGLTKKGTVLLDFWAPWCHACKAIEPHLNELAKTWNDKVKFYKIDVTKNPGLSARLAVMSLPNILIFRDGKVKEQIIGATSKKTVEEKLKKITK